MSVVLLTGASSFTGYWFAGALAEAGHRVIAPLRGRLSEYSSGVRAERVRRLQDTVPIVEACPFGSPQFLALCRETSPELLCHHAARVGDYRSSGFDIEAAVAENTHEIDAVLHACPNLVGLIATGSIFETGEGQGTEPLAAFSPYARSKTQSAQVLDTACQRVKVRFGKFVIANPFGPLQEPRFCHFLLERWKQGQVAQVQTPAYVRDHIHADLLAALYAQYCGEMLNGRAAPKRNPSLYAESQGRFAERLAREVRHRTGQACALELAQQTEFPEPPIRINTEPAHAEMPSWNESAAWDHLIRFYFSDEARSI